MRLTNGTTTLTFTGTRFDDFTDIEQSTQRTGGANLKTIRSGKRFVVTEGLRLTGAEWLALSNLLMSNVESLYYTPTITPDYLEDIDFPMAVAIEVPSKKRHVGGGDKKYYIELKIKGVSYV